MYFVIDAHVLLWNLENSPKLSLKAKVAIDTAERIFIPTIVLLEVYNILEKRKERGMFLDLLEKIQNQRKFVVYPLSIEVVREFIKIEKQEIHDRIIVATAKLLGAPIITKDPEVSKFYPKVIW
ncbi:MAG: hypothetical protein A2126_02210 [Candidatus Woykebacteria bacterium GWB1_45_5]|uniref:PIN domain-containing protein n=2 Tax=Candidatus Woykeibacteriota TaxID=1817899 RepID=A0A1G1W3C4_9BACT|nr:MAG: hypothetical protein A2113_02630 [Candidatus Woykebacteria bacterium GWA1_44_8]OGY23944.1 MAG: hypothetical protein A2126_02210 [Candidatus Woykebacteria bacterium GWB1_45_5]